MNSKNSSAAHGSHHAHSRRKDASPEAVRRERRRVEKLKGEVYKLEQNNFSQLIVYRGQDDWWRIGGNSALIYYYEIRPRIGATQKLLEDRDFFYAFKDGIVSIYDNECLRDQLLDLNFRLVTDTADMMIFALPSSFTPADLKRYRTDKQRLYNEVQRMLRPNICMPELFITMKRLTKTTYNNVRKSEVVFRDAVGIEMLKVAVGVLCNYTLSVNDCMTNTAFLKDALVKAFKLTAYLSVTADLDVWAIDRCARYGREVTKLKELVQAQLKKDLKKSCPKAS